VAFCWVVHVFCLFFCWYVCLFIPTWNSQVLCSCVMFILFIWLLCLVLFTLSPLIALHVSTLFCHLFLPSSLVSPYFSILQHHLLKAIVKLSLIKCRICIFWVCMGYISMLLPQGPHQVLFWQLPGKRGGGICWGGARGGAESELQTWILHLWICLLLPWGLGSGWHLSPRAVYRMKEWKGITCSMLPALY
jgi:hypothetical protein